MYITGDGIETEYPDEGLPGVEQLRTDQYTTLWDEDSDAWRTKYRRFWATDANRKSGLPWRYHICIAKCMYSCILVNWLENLSKTTALNAERPIPIASSWLKNAFPKARQII